MQKSYIRIKTTLKLDSNVRQIRKNRIENYKISIFLTMFIIVMRRKDYLDRDVRNGHNCNFLVLFAWMSFYFRYIR